MKVIIAGSRDINDAGLVELAVEKSGFDITEVISGAAQGVDTLAIEYAQSTGLPCTEIPADWNKYGKGAGPIRNKQMAEYGEALIAIWDGQSRGTANMIETARNKGLKIFVYKIS